jgi:hypothetical protein
VAPTSAATRRAAPPAPGEEAGELSTSAIGVTGGEDVPYELLLWEDRVTAGGTERTGPCWRLRVAGDRPVRGGGDVATTGWPPASALQPVWWADEETVFFAAHEPDVTFVGADGADVVATPLDVQMEDGTAFTFLRVARDGRTEVSFEVRDAGGRLATTAGPLAMDVHG